MPSVYRPQIMLLELPDSPTITFDYLNSYETLFNTLAQSSRFKQATCAHEAVQYLKANHPDVVLAADNALTTPGFKPVLHKLHSYLQEGGMIIFGLGFSICVDSDEMETLFKEYFGLPWKYGSYETDRFQFNPFGILPSTVMTDSFPLTYRMNGRLIQKARRDEKIFVPFPGPEKADPVDTHSEKTDSEPEETEREGTKPNITQSLVSQSHFVKQAEAAIAAGKVFNGFVVYVGNGKNFENIILALCGLGDRYCS